MDFHTTKRNKEVHLDVVYTADYTPKSPEHKKKPIELSEESNPHPDDWVKVIHNILTGIVYVV